MKEFKSKFENVYIKIKYEELKECKKLLKKLGFNFKNDYILDKKSYIFIQTLKESCIVAKSTEIGCFILKLWGYFNMKVYTFDEFKKEYEALYIGKYNKSFSYKVKLFFIRNFGISYGLIKQIIEFEKKQDDKAIKDIKERINNKLKNLVKQNEVMEEREDLVITSSCSAGKIVEVPKKGYLFIDLKTAQEYFKQGGLHKEIALKSGYTEAELNPVRNEWGSKFIGKEIKGYYSTNSKILEAKGNCSSKCKDIFRTEKQAKSALAYAQLTQLMALPEYNGDWVPNWEDKSQVYTIIGFGNNILKFSGINHRSHIAFKSEEIRDKFLENNMDLLKEYFELD